MPCVASCLLIPFPLLMNGSRRIISVICSLVSSPEHAVILLPFSVLIVTAVMRCLAVASSAAASRLVRPVGASCRRTGFDNEPPAILSGNVRFGDGNAGR